MERNQLSPNDLHELAAAYALGALDAGERELFENHLRDGCPLCDGELRALSEITSGLASSLATDPPPRLRQRLMAEVTREPRIPSALPDGVTIARSAKVPWRPMAKGVSFKVLHTDRARRYSTSLVRMDAGSRLPRHRHKDVEELYILSGDLSVSGETVYAGDYCRAAADSVHDESFSETGCLFLLMASQQNEVLA
ncbi:MAG TPA: cupin domain-containing protein [Bryobacteraceae bacterium]|jgi:anti-sigma factor ChrR (cupin superfamily)